jgi:hypothetical protein
MSILGCIQNEISNSEAEIEQVGLNDLEDTSRFVVCPELFGLTLSEVPN